MIAAIILTFILGYLTIVFEHPLKLDKTIPALLMGAICWALLAMGFQNGVLSVIDSHDHIFGFVGGSVVNANLVNEGFENTLLHHFGKTAEILIFLIGAMTIVEIIDLHKGFSVIKGFIKTTNKRKLLWIIGILAFILSSIIDNLTTTIVLITLLRKIVPEKTERWWYAGIIVIAANAGGAWSPIGDVTTTMLWIGEKTSAVKLMTYIILPAIVCFVLPTLIASFLPVFKGNLAVSDEKQQETTPLLSSSFMLYLGLGMIVFVPVFKTFTHLPPYLGMIFSLAIVWLASEYVHPEKDFSQERRHLYSAHKALSRIELSSILFFLGILMAVAALESLVFGTVLSEGETTQVGTLRYLAETLDKTIPNQNIVIILLGVASAVIDNVPLVAAAMGMYDFPLDTSIWHFIAYSAGTGGSMLIIGSAAGVAAMGMEKIDFIWYLRNISLLAALGFLAGAGVFVLIASFLG
jgi:Na+/H+ antiporter NhaD/arsenite permease-like protein